MLRLLSTPPFHFSYPTHEQIDERPTEPRDLSPLWKRRG